MAMQASAAISASIASRERPEKPLWDCFVTLR